jgi:hypothetical protein
MAGRKSREPQPAKSERFTKPHFMNAVPQAQAMPIEPSGNGSGKSQLMPGDVIGVCVRDETSRLAAADVDPQLGGSQK